MIIGYNEESVKSLSLEEFLQVMGHHGNDTDLVADWERITGKKQAKKASEKPEPESKPDKEAKE